MTAGLSGVMAGPRGGDGLRSARSGGRPAAPSCCREFFGQGWMKLEKNERTPHIMKTTKHFNDVSEAGSASLGVPGRGGCGVGGCEHDGLHAKSIRAPASPAPARSGVPGPAAWSRLLPLWSG